MPLYDYECALCNSVSEEFVHSITALGSSFSTCDKCGAPTIRRLNSGVKYRIQTGHFFEPYQDDRLPGNPVVRSPDHFHDICRKNELVVAGKVPDKLR